MADSLKSRGSVQLQKSLFAALFSLPIGKAPELRRDIQEHLAFDPVCGAAR
jgi:hypothetical protein